MRLLSRRAQREGREKSFQIFRIPSLQWEMEGKFLLSLLRSTS
jgi:hypothetical protein